MKTTFVALSCILFFTYSMAQAERTIWYVHPDSALNSIQAGLDSCEDNDIVLVGPGTYVENIIWPNTRGIHMVSELGPDMTIIDGDTVGHVIEITTGIDTATIICGFTIRHGDSDSNGGGIYCDSGTSPSIIDNTIVNNSKEGIFCGNNSCPIIAGNIISGNDLGFYIGGRGGGIHCDNSSPVIKSNIITGNNANGGGGIACLNNSTPSIVDNTISGNTTFWFTLGGHGAGIYCDNSNPSIINNTISGNATDAGGGSGGGIYCIECSPAISGNIITGNTATKYGGGIHCCTDASPTINRCTITNNVGLGGGLNCHLAAAPAIDSCTIANNDGDGVLCSDGAAPTIHYCNITDNTYYGVSNYDANVIVEAKNNWWGDASGPYHYNANPSGTGDPVSDYVDFIPWLDHPVGVEEISGIRPVEKDDVLGATIFSGPLQLPEAKKCRIFDISGRVVAPSMMSRGVYFIEIERKVVQKVIKIK